MITITKQEANTAIAALEAHIELLIVQKHKSSKQFRLNHGQMHMDFARRVKEELERQVREDDGDAD